MTASDDRQSRYRIRCFEAALGVPCPTWRGASLAAEGVVGEARAPLDHENVTGRFDGWPICIVAYTFQEAAVLHGRIRSALREHARALRWTLRTCNATTGPGGPAVWSGAGRCWIKPFDVLTRLFDWEPASA